MKSKQMHSAQSREHVSNKKLQQTRVMNKSNGIVKAYSANTYQGLVRNYNEDRVSIILNISKPEHEGTWPKCSYFGVFDGHGGCLCSDFLRDNLHKYIIEDKNFPRKPIDALKNGFLKAENQFIKLAEKVIPTDKSGSCAIVALIVDKICYIANVGDSRAIVSRNKGLRFSSLSIDHKPNLESQRQRIQKNGGSIYQSNITTKRGQLIPGPFRIFPGRLSVSRAIGDIQAKLQKYFGNPNVLIGDPQIKQFQFDQTHDFILLGCDGIFDKLTNDEIGEVVWKSKKESENDNNFLKHAVTSVIQQAMIKKSLDNLTVVMILLESNNDVPKKSNSTTQIGNSIYRQRESIDEYKLKTCSKEQLMRLNKIDQKRRPSMDTNKQNTNNNNLLHLNCLSNNLSLKQNHYDFKERTERSKNKAIQQKPSTEKQISKLKKKPSQSRKFQFTRPQNFGYKDIKGFMRY